MNHNLVKWAAIGAGAWILWRYLSKASSAENPSSDVPANQLPGYEYNTGNPNAPVGQEVNKESGYKIFPLGH
jgi:hypothetical protein